MDTREAEERINTFLDLHRPDKKYKLKEAFETLVNEINKKQQFINLITNDNPVYRFSTKDNKTIFYRKKNIETYCSNCGRIEA